MILVRPSHEIMEIMGLNYGDPIRLIEKAGRTCYKSEGGITPDSAEKFVKMVRDRGHDSVLEHSAITVKIICDRGVTHEIVRHRLVAYSQESTRYCNYKGGVTFIIPPWVQLEPGEYVGTWPRSKDMPTNLWADAMLTAENQYTNLVVAYGWSPGQARSILPNSLKTEIVMTANIREWRHILRLRTSKAAHPQMQEVMIPILEDFKHMIPILFDDVEV